MLHLKHVDGLRAIAVLAVLVYHAAPSTLSGGFLGVDIFFVVSGFVVTASMMMHTSEGWITFVGGFYFRRMTRILPALLVTLLATAALWVLLIPRSWLSGQSERVALFAFAGLSNWALMDQSDAYFAPRAEFSPFTHTWSLGVEEQFYLVAPILIFLATRFRKVATLALAGLAALSFAGALATAGSDPTLSFYSIATRFWELAAGALWYLVLWDKRDGRQLDEGQTARLVRRWLASGVLLVTICYPRTQAHSVAWALVCVLGTLGLIGTPHLQRTQVSSWLTSKPAQWIGLRSYSLYLWHWPVFVFFRWTVGLDSVGTILVAALLSFLLAATSYRWIETPLRQSMRWKQAPVWVTNAALIALTASGALVAQLMFEHRQKLAVSKVERASVDWYAVHHDPTLPLEVCNNGGLRYSNIGRQLLIEHRPCTSTDTGQRGRSLFVVGDSHATAYLPMLHRLSRDEGVHVTVYQSPGCAYLDLGSPMGVDRPPECLVDARQALSDIMKKALPGDTVLLASLRLPRFGDQWNVDSDQAVLEMHFGSSKARSREAAIADAPTWITPMLKMGLRVVITAPLPIFRAPAFRCVDPWTRGNPICRHGLVESRANELTYRAPVMRTIEQLASRFDPEQFVVFDPFDALCPRMACSAIDQAGRPLFFDADHLSRWGNETLYPAFRRLWRSIHRHAGHTGGAMGESR